MLKFIVTCAAAVLIVSPFSLSPAARSQVETSARMVAPNGAAKGDRLDIGARGGACAMRAWPYYDSDCLYDGLRPAGEVRKVRVVSTDRLAITE
jgi:hypothetical protein